LLVETVTPLALEVALSVQQELQSRWDEADRLRRLQVARTLYASELARRRFLRVDPDNRLVAASLERNGMRSCGHSPKLNRITSASVKLISSKLAQRNERRF